MEEALDDTSAADDLPRLRWHPVELLAAASVAAVVIAVAIAVAEAVINIGFTVPFFFFEAFAWGTPEVAVIAVVGALALWLHIQQVARLADEQANRSVDAADGEPLSEPHLRLLIP